VPVYSFDMNTSARPGDPLELEIASLEAAMVKSNAEIAEVEALLAKKRQSLEVLSVEIRTLKRAATLRPIRPVAQGAGEPPPVSVASLPPESASVSSAGRFRNVVAQIRTSDPGSPALPGG
jgi:hypothetical protein